MAIGKILVPVAGRLENLETLDIALAVSRIAQAHVEALYTKEDAAFLPVTGYQDKTIGWLLENADQIPQQENVSRDAARSAFRGWAEANKIPLAPLQGTTVSPPSARWRECAGAPDRAIADLGRFSDLVVLRQPDPGNSSIGMGLIQAALFEARRPVLLMPKTAGKQLGQGAYCGWDASPEAFCALIAALPLLRQMRHVTLLTIDEVSTTDTMRDDELRSYLECHGVTAKRVIMQPDRRSTAARLIDEAFSAGADLLVIGAYNHSRAREAVFGGTTLQVIETTTLPALLGH